MLGNDGKLEWPIVLRGPTTRALDEILPEAVTACRDGSLDFALYRQVKKQVEKLDEEHRKKLHREEIDGGEYLTGKRFLESLESAVRLIDRPSARQILSGSLKATGRDVPELVLNMAARGLKFAPATPGHESAYHGLFSSMVTCASGATGSSSHRVASPATELHRQDAEYFGEVKTENAEGAEDAELKSLRTLRPLRFKGATRCG